MPKRKKNSGFNVVYYNTTNLPQGTELQSRINKCEGQNEQFLLLFELHKNLTKWDARRKYIEMFQYIDEIQPGRAINSLMDAGVVYISTEKIREERGALNYVYKLWPSDGSFPTDFNMAKLEKINNPIVFDKETGEPNRKDSLIEYVKKQNKKLNEYDSKPYNLDVIINFLNTLD